MKIRTTTEAQTGLLVVDVLVVLEQVLDLVTAFAATGAVVGKALQVFQRLGLAALHQILDLHVGDVLALADDLRDGVLERVGKVVLLQVVVNGRPKRLVTQHRAVELVFRQPSKGIHNLGRRNVVGLFQRHADGHVAHHRRAGDGRRASVGQPFQIGDLPVLHLDSDPHLVATGQGTDLSDPIRGEIIVILPQVMGVHEMLFYRRGVHPIGHETVRITHLATSL